MDAAWVSRLISSRVLIRRASRNTCWPSTTLTPAACRAKRMGSSMTSTPTGSSSRPYSSQLMLDLAGHLLGDAGLRVEGAAQGGDACSCAAGVARVRGCGAVVRGVPVLRLCCGVVQPRVVQLVVLGGRPEVPDDRARRRARAAPKRISLSTAQVPMWVDVMYRMLVKSKASTAPSREPSSSARSRARRRVRSRSKSTRCSQSTAFVPYV